MSWTKQGFKEILDIINNSGRSAQKKLDRIERICMGVLGIDPSPKQCNYYTNYYTIEEYKRLFTDNDWEPPTIAFGE